MKNMNIKRYFILLLMIFTCAVVSHAEFLVVEANTGEKTFYDLGENPVITCKDDLYQVKCENATLELSIADVRKYYFQAESTDLESVLSLNEIFIKASKEGVSIKNGDPGTRVIIYSLDGVQKGDFKISSDGTLEISLDAYPQGVYVVKSDRKTIKIIK